MTLTRRTLNTLLAGAPLAAAWPGAWAQTRRDSVVLGMVLEPPGLDPTVAPAAAIGEIVHYNIFEGLTKVAMDGAVTPLLAESWGHTPDGKTTPRTIPSARLSSAPSPGSRTGGCPGATRAARHARARKPLSRANAVMLWIIEDIGLCCTRGQGV